MKVIIGGDYCPQDRVKKLFNQRQFTEVFGDTIGLLKAADISILNLECPVVFGSEKPMVKAGPNLCGTSEIIDALKDVGVSIVTLANNHFLDYGSQGAINTITELSRIGIEYLGGGANKEEAAKPLLKKVGSVSVAFLNVCEYEFSIAGLKTPGSNPIDLIEISGQIKQVKECVDYVVLIVHGGHEHYQLPSPRMKKLYHYFIDEGVDVVVNHHQHCYSGYEIYKGKHIFYGIGNFCFDNKNKRDSIWNEGILLELNFTQESLTFEMHPFEQCNSQANVKLMTAEKQREFYDKISSLNAIIENDNQLNEAFTNWIEKNRQRYQSYLSPYTNRYLRYLCRLGILPSFLNKNRKDVLYDMIKCESHNDIITRLLEQ